MDWKDELSKKEKELNLEGGAKDVRIRDSSRIINRDTSRRSSDVHLVGGNREIKINNVIGKGGKGMITVDGALKDLEAIEKETNDEGSKAVVKALKVVVKFLSTMRSNQLLTEDDKKRIGAEKAKRQATDKK
jgi:hypothetical protein